MKRIQLKKEPNVASRSYDLWLPVDGTIIYAIGNYDSRKLEISDEELLDYYSKELSSILPRSFDLGLGNINTLLHSSTSNDNLVEQFFRENDSGICLTLSEDRILATRFVAEKEFDGVVTHISNIFQPIIKKVLDYDDALVEFNHLINQNTPEGVLGEFLVENYAQIFGENYDSVSTQVWLDFPEYDMGGKKRRTDIVMRNSILRDWEVFELKRSSVKLTKTISDVPMFVSAVHDAIAQLRNYKQILGQDSVKRSLEARGIQYYNPTINLVIGKRPNLTQRQWDWLMAQHNDLRIITYDDLFDAAKARLTVLKKILQTE